MSEEKHEVLDNRLHGSRHRILFGLRKETPEGIETILKEIRKVELGEHEFVTGYAGAWRYQVKCKKD